MMRQSPKPYSQVKIGFDHPTFSWFSDYAPDCPIRLVALDLPTKNKVAICYLFLVVRALS
jgi:hypothetical protein